MFKISEHSVKRLRGELNEALLAMSMAEKRLAALEQSTKDEHLALDEKCQLRLQNEMTKISSKVWGFNLQRYKLSHALNQPDRIVSFNNENVAP